MYVIAFFAFVIVALGQDFGNNTGQGLIDEGVPTSCDGTGHDLGWLIMLLAGAITLGFIPLMILIWVFWDDIKLIDDEELWDQLKLLVVVVIVAMICIGCIFTPIAAEKIRWLRTYAKEDCGVKLTTRFPYQEESWLPQPDTVIAYVAETGMSEETIEVYKLVAQEAELLVHVGNFDRCDDPTNFRRFLNVLLPLGFPVLAVLGEYDFHLWNDYQNELFDILQVYQIQNAGGRALTCEGYLGSNYWCIYKGIFMSFNSISTLCGYGYWDYKWHLATVSDHFAARDYHFGEYFPWSACHFHKSIDEYQATGIVSEGGSQIYDLCQDNGAIIFNGRHNYMRTYGMGDIKETEVIKACNTTAGCGYDLTNGQTIITSMGTGGYKLWDWKSSQFPRAYMAQMYNAEFGALFCRYNYRGNPKVAYCFFKNIEGDIIDDFFLTHESRMPVMPTA